ncbi:geranylgeranyl transferase type-2 subunit alpha 1 isoform X2 [Prosopis cineraria]|uniref:geranylgeranyl transferase type-2 subunit alpha 1 isoform X2 n=1 Tax=Prosopis cineraria TaxID=364024 RepID=UPI00240F11A2|nr:geranylgeranyl transferase type-2 subunit alpha 1 isoform X2 [Prosopis cineraria]
MHGRPRKALEPVDVAALTAKAEKLRLLQSQFLANHHNRVYSKEALEISARLLEINPESYTAWNYRKLAVEHRVSQSESNPDTIKSIFDEELKVVESALRQNFKSYGAWHHRKWVLSKGYSSMDNELRLLDRFQKADPRNFHAWNYRRFVCALMKRSDEDELNYTEQMIGTNFSNYSAWHNRSVLLSNLMKREVEGYFPKEKVLEEEYNQVQNALFTDPDDQSGWFYHLWLIDQTVKSDAPTLVSSWPFPGSHITLQGNKGLHGYGSSILYPSLLESGIIPVILYFDQAVEGINSSTVAVKTELSIDLNWEPLSTNSLNTAQVWVMHLNLRNMKLQLSKSYLIEIIIGHYEGIVSSSGYHYGHPSQISFKLCVQTAFTEPADHQGGKVISWENDNFQKYEHFQQADFMMSDHIITGSDIIPATSNWCAETIGNEVDAFRVLLSESDCKIGKLTLARMLTAYDSISSAHAKGMVYTEEILELYADLLKFDPMHSPYYKDERSLVLLRQITSARESLLLYCHHYGNSTETNDGYVCLRLQNLSLSRMGSVECLLWVQMLDLSNNGLRSIEGLEAMQLLSCLNLGHNNIGSFTALGPLRLLKSLKVLDISYNEIGSRSIDTTRYLCSSPLSHTEEYDWDLFESLSSDVNAPNIWEAFLVFKSLNLKQLDMTGNAVAVDKFRSFLVKLLPTLKWLDGEELH